MRPEELTVASIQLSSQDAVDQNLDAAFGLVRRATARGAQLVVLPENFAFMGPEHDKRAIAEAVQATATDADGPIVSTLRNMARDTGAHVIAGGMPEQSGDPERPYNTSVVVDPSGRVVATYRKIHLFDVEVGDGHVYRESASTSAGDRAVVADVRGAGIGLTVCYDLRFPELFRRLSDRGAVVATVPAAFTLMTGKDHWHVLLRARAIESQMFVVAAAQCGNHPRGRQTYGKSCIIDPWGDVVAQASDGPGFVVCTLDLGRVDAVRRTLPSLQHRRPIG
ncbi:MAG: carbon-nitrogen hydrolase family protein [Polyangiaceae bacterium]|nr:carbon-nitrogen hydrolase family protein [Polyangiaceae bacterium]